MKKYISRLFIIIFSLIMIVGVCPENAMAAAKTSKITVTATYKYDEAYKVLKILNKERRKNNLPELKMDKTLLSCAMLRAAEITYQFSHTRPDESSCFSVSPLVYGENIALGQENASWVMNSWMNSSGHRANILDQRYTCVGIGAVYYNGNYYWTQNFGIHNTSSCSKPANKEANISITVPAKSNAFVSTKKISTSQVPGTKFSIKLQKKANDFDYVNFIPKASSFTWKSSNKSVATVSKNGTVTTKKEGKTTISALYKGTSVKAYSITLTVKKDISKSKVTMKTSYTYTGSKIKPAITVKYKKNTLKKGRDYTVSYSNNINAGNGTVTIKGKGNYAGKLNKKFKIKKVSPSKLKINVKSMKLKNEDALFDEIYKNLSITYKGKTLVADTDYYIQRVRYNMSEGRIKSFTISFYGNYSGSKEIKS